MKQRLIPPLIVSLLVVLLATAGSNGQSSSRDSASTRKATGSTQCIQATRVANVEADIRDELRELLLTYWDITLEPSGGNLDVAEIHTDQGFCASPVIVQLPAKWVSAFAEEESLEYLATLISEAVSTDTTTELVELRVAGDWLRRPVLKVVRR